MNVGTRLLWLLGPLPLDQNIPTYAEKQENMKKNLNYNKNEIENNNDGRKGETTVDPVVSCYNLISGGTCYAG